MLRKVLGRGLTTLSSLAKVDPIQEAAFKENCILVNERDEIIGHASKKQCHLITPNGDLPLHRAFSLFLFNSKHELLIHKRSDTKITFPGHFTNSCCSHPLYDIQEEREEPDAVGIKLAVQRRLNHELGIPKDYISPNELLYLTRIIYKAKSDSIWGEHEIDYILFLIKDLPIKPNPEEISEALYIGKNELSDFIHGLKDPVTPWFNLISQFKLKTWWNDLDNLCKFQDHVNIHQL